MVKHLQRIEEQILESKAWTRSSPIWDAIAACGDQGVPSCEEVSLPGGDQALGQSPLSHLKTAGGRSPIVGDRFKSPIVTAVARRQLFSGGQPGQSVLATTSPQHSPMKGYPLYSPMKAQPKLSVASTAIQPPTGVTPAKPRRTGSLALFLRKVGQNY